MSFTTDCSKFCPFVILFQPVSVHDASFAEASDRQALITGWLSGYAHGNFQVSTTIGYRYRRYILRRKKFERESESDDFLRPITRWFIPRKILRYMYRFSISRLIVSISYNFSRRNITLTNFTKCKYSRARARARKYIQTVNIHVERNDTVRFVH